MCILDSFHRITVRNLFHNTTLLQSQIHNNTIYAIDNINMTKRFIYNLVLLFGGRLLGDC